ncbi:DVU_1557 family redox protein [Dethiosulfatarculus sandiegensis]|uniref:DNA-binding protein n=1 Tax=Dethiosulfatarculus sandiegensis TaxID=1429043 RepID=A0A0D2JA53_9BACT|nr:CLJU_RS11820 family redox protein [Dethiosulfatarculus sandiegensis]KIX12586.1 DNA-binding protein [Dethiosulfatarculus sandiegensis]
MAGLYATEKDLAWTCAACGKALELKNVELEYMGSRFKVELPCCPNCGLTLIPEDLARGKMQEVEKLLEDK